MVDVKIRKLNEVYLHLDCDLGILYELEPLFTFEVPGAKYSPKFKMKVWDGKIKLLSIYKRRLYVGLLDMLCQKLTSLGYTYEVLFETVDTTITPEVVAEHVKSLNLKTQDKDLVLRDYQYVAVHAALKYRRRTLLSPTASGKSALIYILVRWFLENDMRVLVIVPSTSLIYQMIGDFDDYSQADEWNAEKNCHVIMSGKSKITNKDVTVSTWQSLQNEKVSEEWLNGYDAVIVDEAHGSKAAELTKILETATGVQYRLGFTGSLDQSKTNQLVIQGLFGTITKVTTTRQLIDDGHVSDIELKCLVLKYNKQSAKIVSHLDYQKEIDFIVSHEKRNKFIKNLALSTKGNTLVLYTLIEKHGDILFDLLKDNPEGREVYYIHGGVDAEDRDAVRAIIEKSDNAIVLASVGTFSQGINIKKIHNLVFASPTKSIIRVLQSLGRGLRLAEGKSVVNVYDISDLIYKTKTKQNYTYTHLIERLKIYSGQEFHYKIIEVPIE
jgi:superfamily II DNA or RNA helicase